MIRSSAPSLFTLIHVRYSLQYHHASLRPPPAFLTKDCAQCTLVPILHSPFVQA